MRQAFPDAVIVGYELLTGAMTCHDKDRHVLAAAVMAKADVLVTFNLKDFPASSTEKYDIDVVHPDDFLLDQLDLYPGPTVQSLRQQVDDYSNPAMTIDDLLTFLGTAGVPKFTDAVRRHL